jgi:XRE family transcriptional regulator, regulator of sulfur utilization
MARSFDELASRVAESWDEDTQTLHAAASAYFATLVRGQAAIGKQIAALRAEQNMTQTELAQATDVPQPEISRIERGTGNPTRDTLIRLAHALHANVVLVPNDDIEIRLGADSRGASH